MSTVVVGALGAVGLVLLGVLTYVGQRIGDRIAHGPGRRRPDHGPGSAAQHDRHRGDSSGLGGI